MCSRSASSSAKATMSMSTCSALPIAVNSPSPSFFTPSGGGTKTGDIEGTCPGVGPGVGYRGEGGRGPHQGMVVADMRCFQQHPAAFMAAAAAAAAAAAGGNRHGGGGGADGDGGVAGGRSSYELNRAAAAAAVHHQLQLYDYHARLRSLGVLNAAGGYPLLGSHVGSGGGGGFGPFHHAAAGSILSYLYRGGKQDRTPYMTGPGGGFPVQEEPKPSHSYIGIIAMAILSSKEKKLVLSDIYQWILDNYPYFRRRGPGWRNSIRHNLSLNDCFVKSGRSANGKGHYWAIHPANTEDFTKGDFRRRRAQRKVRKAMGLSVPDEDDSPSPSPTPPGVPIGAAAQALQEWQSRMFGIGPPHVVGLQGAGQSDMAVTIDYRSRLFEQRGHDSDDDNLSNGQDRFCNNQQGRRVYQMEVGEELGMVSGCVNVQEMGKMVGGGGVTVGGVVSREGVSRDVVVTSKKRLFDVESLLAPDAPINVNHNRGLVVQTNRVKDCSVVIGNGLCSAQSKQQKLQKEERQQQRQQEQEQQQPRQQQQHEHQQQPRETLQQRQHHHQKQNQHQQQQQHTLFMQAAIFQRTLTRNDDTESVKIEHNPRGSSPGWGHCTGYPSPSSKMSPATSPTNDDDDVNVDVMTSSDDADIDDDDSEFHRAKSTNRDVHSANDNAVNGNHVLAVGTVGRERGAYSQNSQKDSVLIEDGKSVKIESDRSINHPSSPRRLVSHDSVRHVDHPSSPGSLVARDSGRRVNDSISPRFLASRQTVSSFSSRHSPSEDVKRHDVLSCRDTISRHDTISLRLPGVLSPPIEVTRAADVIKMRTLTSLDPSCQDASGFNVNAVFTPSGNIKLERLN